MHHEARWPVAVATLGVLGLSLGLPNYHGALPPWLSACSAVVLLLALAMASRGGDRRRWQRVERLVVAAVVLFILGAEIAKLASLIGLIIRQDPASSGIVLLAASVAIWLNNIFAFSLLYWQLDRGGPAGRDAASEAPADWRFFEEGEAGCTATPWRPRYIAYLYLAFSTATAFSSTDTAVPVTERAKLLSMLQAVLSLTTMAVVASRAINVLGD